MGNLQAIERELYIGGSEFLHMVRERRNIFQGDTTAKLQEAYGCC